MICCAGTDGLRRRPSVLFLLVASLGLASGVDGAKRRSAVELTNPLLGPGYAQWLVGPISYMASEEEIDRYLALRDDEEAERFIEEFWKGQDPYPEAPGNLVKRTFEERAAEADKKFSEAARAGHRTDRGTIWVLYGPPEETEYEAKKSAGAPDVEVWTYPKKAEPGLDGERPDRKYRFAKVGELTTFYVPRNRPNVRDRFRPGVPRDPIRDPP